MSAADRAGGRFGLRLDLAGAWLRLIRVENCVAVAGSTIVGGCLGGPVGAGVMIAACTVAALEAAGNVLNDRCDVQVDAIARPNRALPCGAVTPAAADKLWLVLTAVGLVLACILGPVEAAVAAVVVLLSTAYSMRLKRRVLVGNLVNATLVGATVPFGALAAGRVPLAAVFGAALVATHLLAFEILKCVQDVDSDSVYGIRTIATVHGTNISLRAAEAVLLGFSLLAIAGLGITSITVTYAVALVLPLGCVASCLWLLRSSRPLPRAVHLGLVVLKLSWFGSMPAMLLLR